MSNQWKRWKTAEVDTALAKQVATRSQVPTALAQLLVSRGLTDPDDVDRFLTPRLSDLSDPFQLPGMADAVERVCSAISKGERIVVFGDYDVDGITSTALLTLVLGRFKAAVFPFLPQRVEEGYGLSIEALERCIEAHQPQLIITVDCGTGSVEAVERARELGVDVVVTDHHEASQAVAPAVAVVNPKLDPETRELGLAGVGVAFKLCHALVKQTKEAIDLRDYLDLVAMGTIADVVPLVGENRILARRGLERLHVTTSVGLGTLKEVCKIDVPPQAYHVGFILGPRLNAAGRLGDAQQALDLLLTQDPLDALEMAQHLDSVNRERRDVEARLLVEAFEKIDQWFDPSTCLGVVVSGEGWHPGVIGIVASRIVERYYRPTAVLAMDDQGLGRGSCRSIAGCNVVEALKACADLLEKYGGHEMAAGFEIKAEHVEAFKKRFNEVVASQLDSQELRPVQRVDGWISLLEADEELFQNQERLRPFGHGNPTPVWGATGVRPVTPPKVVGAKHLKMVVAVGGTELDCIAFGLGAREIPRGPLDLAFQLKKNLFRGRESLQLNIQDFRPQDAE